MNLFDWIREIRKLRRCNSVLQLGEYTATKLRAPANVAWWLTNIQYVDEKPCVWRSAEETLASRNKDGWQFGNCSEIACVALAAMQYLPDYECQILCIYGVDENNEKQGHSVLAFKSAKEKGFIDHSQCHKYPVNTPWAKIAIEKIRPLWLATTYNWADEKGHKKPGVL